MNSRSKYWSTQRTEPVNLELKKATILNLFVIKYPFPMSCAARSLKIIRITFVFIAAWLMSGNTNWVSGPDSPR